MDLTPDKIKPQAPDIIDLGTPRDLVLDDNPLEPLLYGGKAVAPTPAGVLDLWQSRMDRSEPCARALAELFVRNGKLIAELGDLDDAEVILRLTLGPGPMQPGDKRAGYLAALGQVLELKHQPEAAEGAYREALALQEEFLGGQHEVTRTTLERLIGVLTTLNRAGEATDLCRRMKVWQEKLQPESRTGLLELRTMALDLFMAGHHAQAEAAYHLLLQREFEPGSNHVHLARVYLMTNRDAEARASVEQAWNFREQSGNYVRCRILFLKALLQMLAGADANPELRGLREFLHQPGAFTQWHVQHVLDHLKARMNTDDYELMTTIADVINEKDRIIHLDTNPLWIAMCRSADDHVDKTSAG